MGRLKRAWYSVERSVGRLLLGLVMDKDGRAVLRTAIGALPIEGGGVVMAPELREEGVERDPTGVEGDQHSFGVTGPASAHLLIRRMVHLTALVAGDGVFDPGNGPEELLDPPEAPCGEGGSIQSVRNVVGRNPRRSGLVLLCSSEHHSPVCSGTSVL